MMDSEAARHACPVRFAHSVKTERSEKVHLKAASGGPLKL